jgi:hypothetical protein
MSKFQTNGPVIMSSFIFSIHSSNKCMRTLRSNCTLQIPFFNPSAKRRNNISIQRMAERTYRCIQAFGICLPDRVFFSKDAPLIHFIHPKVQKYIKKRLKIAPTCIVIKIIVFQYNSFIQTSKIYKNHYENEPILTRKLISLNLTDIYLLQFQKSWTFSKRHLYLPPPCS